LPRKWGVKHSGKEEVGNLVKIDAYSFEESVFKKTRARTSRGERGPSNGKSVPRRSPIVFIQDVASPFVQPQSSFVLSSLGELCGLPLRPSSKGKAVHHRCA